MNQFHDSAFPAPPAMQHIEWAEIKFPPINLWVLAGSPALTVGLENTRNHRPQRPGMKNNRANSLRYFGHVQMQKILAMHGGKP